MKKKISILLIFALVLSNFNIPLLADNTKENNFILHSESSTSSSAFKLKDINLEFGERYDLEKTVKKELGNPNLKVEDLTPDYTVNINREGTYEAKLKITSGAATTLAAVKINVKPMQFDKLKSGRYVFQNFPDNVNKNGSDPSPDSEFEITNLKENESMTIGVFYDSPSYIEVEEKSGEKTAYLYTSFRTYNNFVINNRKNNQNKISAFRGKNNDNKFLDSDYDKTVNLSEDGYARENIKFYDKDGNELDVSKVEDKDITYAKSYTKGEEDGPEVLTKNEFYKIKLPKNLFITMHFDYKRYRRLSLGGDAKGFELREYSAKIKNIKLKNFVNQHYLKSKNGWDMLFDINDTDMNFEPKFKPSGEPINFKGKVCYMPSFDRVDKSYSLSLNYEYQGKPNIYWNDLNTYMKYIIYGNQIFYISKDKNKTGKPDLSDGWEMLFDPAQISFDQAEYKTLKKIDYDKYFNKENQAIEFSVVIYDAFKDKYSKIANYSIPILDGVEQIESKDKKVTLNTLSKNIIPRDAKISLKEVSSDRNSKIFAKIPNDKKLRVKAFDLSIKDKDNKAVEFFTKNGKILDDDKNKEHKLFFQNLDGVDPNYVSIYKKIENEYVNLDIISYPTFRSYETKSLGIHNASLGMFDAMLKLKSTLLSPDVYGNDDVKKEIDGNKLFQIPDLLAYYTKKREFDEKFKKYELDGEYVFVETPILDLDKIDDMDYDNSSGKMVLYTVHDFNTGSKNSIVKNIIAKDSKNYNEEIEDAKYFENLAYVDAINAKEYKHNIYLDLVKSGDKYIEDLKVAGIPVDIISSYKVGEKTYPKRVRFALQGKSAYQNISYKIAGEEKEASLALHFRKKRELAKDTDFEELESPVIKSESGKDKFKNEDIAKISITSSLNDGEIYYTLDGTEPSKNSIKYNGVFDLKALNTELKTYEIKAIVYNKNKKSKITSKLFTFRKLGDLEEDAKKPIIKTRPVMTNDEFLKFSIEITSEEGSEIYYTLDGSLPTTKSEKYTKKLVNNFVAKLENYGPPIKIRAIAIKEGKNSSEISEKEQRYTNKWFDFIAIGEEFEVRTEMLNHSNPSLYSMGNGALTHKATLYRDESGLKLKIGFTGINMGNVLAYLNNLWYFESKKIANEGNGDEGKVQAMDIEHFDFIANERNDNIKFATIPLRELVKDGKPYLDNMPVVKIYCAIAPDEMGKPRAIIETDYSNVYKEITGTEHKGSETIKSPIIDATLLANGEAFEIDIKKPAGTEIAKVYYSASKDFNYNPNIKDIKSEFNKKLIFNKKDYGKYIVIVAYSKIGEKISKVTRRILQFKEEQEEKEKPEKPEKPEEPQKPEEKPDDSKPAKEKSALEKLKNLQDGKYWINIDLYKKGSNTEKSMGNVAFDNNRRAFIEVKNKKASLQLASNPVRIQQYYSALKNMKYDNGGIMQYVRAIEKEKIKTEFEGEKKEFEYLKKFSLDIANINNDFIEVAVQVPYTPMDEVVGVGFIDARLRLDFASVKLAESGDKLDSDNTEAEGNASYADMTKTAIKKDDNDKAILESKKIIEKELENIGKDSSDSVKKDISDKIIANIKLVSENLEKTKDIKTAVKSLNSLAAKSIEKVGEKNKRDLLLKQADLISKVIDTKKLDIKETVEILEDYIDNSKLSQKTKASEMIIKNKIIDLANKTIDKAGTISIGKLKKAKSGELVLEAKKTDIKKAIDKSKDTKEKLEKQLNSKGISSKTIKKSLYIDVDKSKNKGESKLKLKKEVFEIAKEEEAKLKLRFSDIEFNFNNLSEAKDDIVVKAKSKEKLNLNKKISGKSSELKAFNIALETKESKKLKLDIEIDLREIFKTKSEDDIMVLSEKDGKIRKVNFKINAGKILISKKDLGNISINSYENNFADVKSHWAERYVNSLSAKGIINGLSEKEFNLEKPVTRAEFAKMIVNAFDIQGASKTKLKDIKDDAWYKPYVEIANANGLIKGFPDGSFKPDANISREEMAVIVRRTFENIKGKIPNVKKTSFNDDKNFSSWSRESINKLEKIGILELNKNKKFIPKEVFKRSEAAALIYRLIKN